MRTGADESNPNDADHSGGVLDYSTKKGEIKMSKKMKNNNRGNKGRSKGRQKDSTNASVRRLIKNTPKGTRYDR